MGRKGRVMPSREQGHQDLHVEVKPSKEQSPSLSLTPSVYEIAQTSAHASSKGVAGAGIEERL